MFLQMRMALQSQRGFDNMAQDKPIPRLTSSARDALRWATLGNAEKLGMASRIGSLAPGKLADIILLRANDLNMFPVNDPVQSLVFQANGGNVDTVFVAGRRLKSNGKLAPELDTLVAANRHKLADSGRRLAALI
jgi:5-methylthioadenosine/S-adenosylhomocysteine deaminase